MTERDLGKEKIFPNEVLDGAVTYFILEAIAKGLVKEKSDPKIIEGVISHIAGSGSFEATREAPKKEKFAAQKDTILNLGNCAFEALSMGCDIKDLARGKFDPRLIAYAPQALLLSSYLPLLENLPEIANGKKQYGYGKELDRLQPQNSMASGEMMKGASKRIAEDVAGLTVQRGLTDVGILEFGCGNASFSAAVLTVFKEQGLKLPKILPTDINPKTQVTAEKLFKEKGFEENLELMEVDMGNIGMVRKAANKLEGKTIIVHIGYILHENRRLAVNTLKALTEVFGNKNVIFAFSEYYLQNNISPEVPLWFQTIHKMTQDLFERQELMDFVGKFGLSKFRELEHNVRKDNKEIMNSTTYWTI